MLSLAVLYQHVVPCDHGKFVGCMHPVPSPTTLAFDYVGRLGTSEAPHPPILVGRWFSRFTYSSLSLQPADLLAHLSELTRFSPSRRGRLLPGFRSDWSPAPPPDITTGATGQVPLAGLSPARTPTSIAAPDVSFLNRSTVGRVECLEGVLRLYVESVHVV